MIKPLTLLLAALLALSACESVDVPNTPVDPSANPSSTPNPIQTPILTTPAVLVQVQIQIQTVSGQVISGAEVSLSSPSQPTLRQSTDASGRTTFRDLRNDVEYTLDVNAQGFEAASRRANLAQLATQGQKQLLLAIELNPVSASLKGRVIDSSGAPVVGATVFDTRQSVSTDSLGRFTLGYSSGGDLRLAISKTGFQASSRTISIQPNTHQDLGDISLTRRSGPLQLGIDLSHGSLGQSADATLNSYTSLQNAIVTEGLQVRTLASSLLDQLDQLDVLMILSPSTNFSVEEIGAIQAFVLSGRKLIVSGEWAGFAGFDGQAANLLLTPFNIQFGLDTLRESDSGFLNVRSFSSHPITTGLNQLKLYQSGSVKLAASQGDLLARTASGSFQIAANTGSFAVLAATAYGSGKVVVLGDSSIWSNQDSDGNGTANFDEADNRKLLQQILNW